MGKEENVHALCADCKHSCKQFEWVEIVTCKKLQEKHKPIKK
jgi:hypothetical protein